jgi:hypothetical protein
VTKEDVTHLFHGLALAQLKYPKVAASLYFHGHYLTILMGGGPSQWRIVDSMAKSLGGEHGFIAECRTTNHAVEVLMQYGATKLSDDEWSNLFQNFGSCARREIGDQGPSMFQAFILGIRKNQATKIGRRWEVFRSNPAEATSIRVSSF